jgi:DNA-binding MarR family transcriptional regulator
MTTPSPVEVFDGLHDLLHLFRTRTLDYVELSHPELTLNEMRVLMYTGRNAGITQKELVERSHTDKAQMTRILASLEDRDLLERRPSDSDRRVRCLRLSEKGAALFAQLRDVQDRIGGDLLKSLPMDVQRKLLNACQQVCKVN